MHKGSRKRRKPGGSPLSGLWPSSREPERTQVRLTITDALWLFSRVGNRAEALLGGLCNNMPNQTTEQSHSQQEGPRELPFPFPRAIGEHPHQQHSHYASCLPRFHPSPDRRELSARTQTSLLSPSPQVRKSKEKDKMFHKLSPNSEFLASSLSGVKSVSTEDTHSAQRTSCFRNDQIPHGRSRGQPMASTASSCPPALAAALMGRPGQDTGKCTFKTPLWAVSATQM